MPDLSSEIMMNSGYCRKGTWCKVDLIRQWRSSFISFLFQFCCLRSVAVEQLRKESERERKDSTGNNSHVKCIESYDVSLLPCALQWIHIFCTERSRSWTVFGTGEALLTLLDFFINKPHTKLRRMTCNFIATSQLVQEIMMKCSAFYHMGNMHGNPFVTLDHKTSLKSLGYICSNSQKYIVWVKIIDFSFMPKIIRILSKAHVPWRYFVNFLP